MLRRRIEARFRQAWSLGRWTDPPDIWKNQENSRFIIIPFVRTIFIEVRKFPTLRHRWSGRCSSSPLPLRRNFEQRFHRELMEIEMNLNERWKIILISWYYTHCLPGFRFWMSACLLYGQSQLLWICCRGCVSLAEGLPARSWCWSFPGPWWASCRRWCSSRTCRTCTWPCRFCRPWSSPRNDAGGRPCSSRCQSENRHAATVNREFEQDLNESNFAGKKVNVYDISHNHLPHFECYNPVRSWSSRAWRDRYW